jgi:predicted O-methyltransferase YrrM
VTDLVVAPPPTPRDTLQQLLFGYRVSQGLMVAAKLGLADLLAAGPHDCTALAQASGTHAPSLYRLLRLLASVGVFAEDDQQRFALTPTATFLRSDVDGTLRHMAMFMGEESHWRSWGDLLHSVRTGAPAFAHLYGMGHFAYLARHPEEAATFDAFMADQTANATTAIVSAYDFADASTVVDIGGGRGTLLAAILAAYPALRGILFDQPQVVEGAKALLAARGLTDRCALSGGDIFQAALPGGDTYVLQQILHDWDDEQARRILERCHAALPPGGRLLIVERLIAPGNAPSPAKSVDMQMLVMLGGRERTEKEYADLLASAGFRLARVLPTRSPFSILEARRAD